MTDLVMLKNVLSEADQTVWDDTVYTARRLCEKVDIEYEDDSMSVRFRLMQLFANTSIENAVMKKIFLPLLVRFQGNKVLDTLFIYGNNKNLRFMLLRYNQSHACMDGLVDARQFCASFSFFHTQRYQEKLAKIMEKKRKEGRAARSAQSEGEEEDSMDQ